MSQCYIAYIPNAGLTKEMRVVKIGYSVSPSARFEQLCAMGWLMPGWIEATTLNSIYHGSEIERFMHDKLRLDRVHHEWFHVADSVLQEAKKSAEYEFDVSWVLDDISDRENLGREQAA